MKNSIANQEALIEKILKINPDATIKDFLDFTLLSASKKQK